VKLLNAVLDQPAFWDASRVALDLAFGLYRKRFTLLRKWGLADAGLTVLDVGCGIGHYATMTSGAYLGVDHDPRYIEYARKRHGQPGHTFRCMDVARIGECPRTDVVLIVDALHHLSDAVCKDLLKNAGSLARYRIVSFEPIREQRGPIGRWIIQHDRGKHMRSLANLHALFSDTGIALTESEEIRLGPICTRAILGMPLQPDDSKRQYSGLEMHNE
jgi:2-polyprenyl-3-methyl-5-hydroxy-6-metoxy-1,4-benzoquinol methylase